ncbi:MAG: hypothetical protein UY85_C0084G0002 [Candidatus Peribacteria bacterium GW2011_GWB1_54_5]|nr:MAG: hypothetical protein UY85_C0084G0002 [Candidatus Peribacteria bacterium GW2011_GWB1_54_5]
MRLLAHPGVRLNVHAPVRSVFLEVERLLAGRAVQHLAGAESFYTTGEHASVIILGAHSLAWWSAGLI